MAVKLGINGFGRIGRNVFRAAVQNFPDIEVVGINDLLEPGYLAYMLQYDSVHGTLPSEVHVVDDGIMVDGDTLKVLQVRDPKELPWAELEVDVVIESTGFFTDRDQAAWHLEAGAPFERAFQLDPGARALVVADAFDASDASDGELPPGVALVRIGSAIAGSGLSNAAFR